MALGKAYFSDTHRRTSRDFGNESSTSKKEQPPNILRKGIALGFILMFLYSCGSTRKVVLREKKTVESKAVAVETSKQPSQNPSSKPLTNKEKIENYIQKFSTVAQKEMKAYGIPASITLAQGILESGMGYGRLATEGNNHFGIKCHKEWKGKTIYHDDDQKGECFRVYKNPISSYRDHSIFLASRDRYAFLFSLKRTHYKAWAKGLKKAGYATDPKYPEKLISLIERFDLTRFDTKPKKINRSENSVIHQDSEHIHTVKKGDTLYSLSKLYEVPVKDLIQINQITDQTIYLGQELKIPPKK